MTSVVEQLHASSLWVILKPMTYFLPHEGEASQRNLKADSE